MYQNKSINQIVDAVRNVAENHPMVFGFGCGHTEAIGTNKETGEQLKRPFLWIDYVSTNYDLNQNTKGIAYKVYTFAFIVLDKYSPNVKNSNEVMSDTEAILADFIQYIATAPELKAFKIALQSYSATPVRDDAKDGDEGWTVNVAFKIPYDYCFKNLPIYGNPGPR